MAMSENFGFCNVENFRIYVDNLNALEKYLKLAVDTILGVEPEKIHISNFYLRYNAIGKEIPKNWEPDGDGGYWKIIPAHYWVEESKKPLEVCIIGSDSFIDSEKMNNGRRTFADQNSLVNNVMNLINSKKFNKDVLKHIPKGEYEDDGINKKLLMNVLESAEDNYFDLRDFGGEIKKITKEDLIGFEGIGYKITQTDNIEKKLLISLCKTYYPR